MTVAIDDSTADVSCLSSSLAAFGFTGIRPHHSRPVTESEKAAILEKRKLSFDSFDSDAHSITSTAVEVSSDLSVYEVKPWIVDEELARSRHENGPHDDAIHIKIRYGNRNTDWRVYPTTRVWRLKRSFAYRYARDVGPDALQFNFDRFKMQVDSRIRDFEMEEGDIIDALPDFTRMHGG